MVNPSTSPIFLPIFGGQGSLKFDPENSSTPLLLYTRLPSADVLYDACYDAFHAELRSLPLEMAERVDICACDFKEKASILSPTLEKYLLNPVVSGTSLLLHQALQYLHFVEKVCSGFRTDRGSLEEIFSSNAEHNVGVLGFSSGILAAATVAASRTKLDFIKHAVEAYRLAFWIGVRVQLYRSNAQPCQNLNPKPWALVVICDRSDVERSVLGFNKASPEACVHITVVIDDSCVTVSGHPDHLLAFKAFLPDNAVVCDTNVAGLYHVSSKLYSVRETVLMDVLSRKIQFPTFSEIFVPLRCSCTGEILHSSEECLVRKVVDMILMDTLRWDRVVKSTSASISFDCPRPVQILDFEGGKRLMKSLTKSLEELRFHNFQCLEMGQERMVQPSSRQEPIAIIGMAVNMPGAKSVDELWDILSSGLKTLQPIPPDRFGSSIYTTGQIRGRSMQVDTGNFIQDVGWFDNKFFGINPREATSMDPQQRILLQVTYEALEDAGYIPDATPTFSRDTFGCYIGAATHDYVHNLRQNIDVYYTTGTLGSFLSGRLSYCLGFGGPSMVIDTACSSSIVAIHQACRALSNRDCNAAIAGGVNVISGPDTFIGLDKAHLLSSTGCKSFDAAADGYSRAEGCGVFVFKRLSDAVDENDRILGVIRAVEVNQSGMTHSILHPHGPTQEALLERVLLRSDIDPRLVNFVESHGTGTQAGDVNELQSIRRILAAERSPNNPLYVGSIKASIGHLEAASGSAGLAKVLLMLRHKTIPGQVSFKNLNPKIPCLDIDNTIISTKNIPWLPAMEDKSRFALVNNFGAAGSNATMIIEEYIVPVKSPPSDVSSYVFALSAKDHIALEKMRKNLIHWLQLNKEASIADISYTLMARRQVYAYRLVVTAATLEELISRLEHSSPVHIHRQDSPVIFVFSGQGSQFPGMGSTLYRSCSLFRRCINDCDFILRAAHFGSILPFIVEPALQDENNEELYATAVFSLEYALAMLWISWGIKPTAVVGHSLGEYVALVIAGVFSLSDALNLVAKRSRLLLEKCVLGTSGMLAVSLEPAKLRTIFKSSRSSNLSISCYNSPQACVISGPMEELATLREYLESMVGCHCTPLNVPFACHSPAMNPILDDLTTLGNHVEARSPSIPVVSTVLGRVVMPGDAAFSNSGFLAEQCAGPVRFVDAIESFVSYPDLHTSETTWIEIGPHASLFPMLKSFPSLSSSSIITSLDKKHDNWASLCKALASLYLTHSINWKVIFSQIGDFALLSPPSYPFSPKKYWVTYREPGSLSGTEFSVIRNWEQYPSDSNMQMAIFGASVSDLMPYMDGHRVSGVSLCPASVLVELAAASTILALKQTSRHFPDSALEFNEFTFTKPLMADSDLNTRLRISVDTKSGSFSISSDGSASVTYDQVICAEGRYKLLGKQEVICKFRELVSSVWAPIKHILNSPPESGGPKRYSTRAIYDLLFARVVNYSEEFQTIQELTLSGLEAVANVRIDVGFQSRTFAIEILLADTLLHVPGLVANVQGSQMHAYVCSEIDSLVVLPCRIDKKCTYTIYCKVSKLSDGMICESYAFREGQVRVLVAVAQGVRFQRVTLSGLKFGLTYPDGLADVSSSNSMKNVLVATENMTCRSIKTPPSPAAVEKDIRKIFSQVSDMDESSIDEDIDLGSLGFDSLSCLEVVHLLATQCGVHLPANFINPSTNIRQIRSHLTSPGSSLASGFTFLINFSGNSPAGLDFEKRLWCLRKVVSSHPPLVLIHDGSGLAVCYRHILNIDRDLYGINNPFFLSSQEWPSIAELATAYSDYIQDEFDGPVIVGGWSFGGIAAFEVARTLRARSFAVIGVILIDTPCPNNRAELKMDVFDYVLRNTKSIDSEFRELCRSQFLMSSKLLGEYKPSAPKDDLAMPIVFLRSIDGFNTSNLTDVPDWLANRDDVKSIVSGWDVLSGSTVEQIDIPGNHFQPFEAENVEAVSLAISKACRILEA